MLFLLIKEHLGNPGEIRGTVNNDNFGEIIVNSNFGIFGNLAEEKIEDYNNTLKMPIGLRNSIELGEATIISNYSGERKKYKIMIDKIYLDDVQDNKSFAIRIIDDELINQTRAE